MLKAAGGQEADLAAEEYRSGREGSGRWIFPLAALVLGGAAGLLPVLAGCGPGLAPSKPLAALTAQERAGRELYVARCGGCHYPNSSAPLHGPGLYAVLRNPYLPSGAPATEERVTEVVVRGRGMMPAFGRTLEEGELQQLLAYLHTL